MTDGSGFTHHSAAYDSTVGIQAETVHNSNVYIVHPEASPHDKYNVGLRFLKNGVPSRARELITEAIANGHDNAEVRFHWVLAMLSKRSYHDLSAEERQQLHQFAGSVDASADGEWETALHVVLDLLELLGDADGETGFKLKRLRDLSPPQRDLIVHHLDLVLTGGMKDSLWAETRELAETDRCSNDRHQRVWAYFEPVPIGPRAQLPQANSAHDARKRIGAWAALFGVTTGFLWVSAVIAHPVAAVIELLVALGAVFSAAHFGLQWWYQEHRLKAKNEYFSWYANNAPPAGDGFTRRVHHSFNHYFSVRVPVGFDPEQWLTYTRGVRNSLVAEIAFLYRESRISVERVNWLIRYLAQDVRARHDNGTLFAYRQQYQTSVKTKAICVMSLVVMGITAIDVTMTAIGSSPNILLSFLAIVGAVWGGRKAVFLWLHMRSEERRFAEETKEHNERLSARQAEHQRWKTFVDETRPSELQMETWLTCDKTLFVDEVLRHYQLAWRDIITHTILITPVRPYKRGREKGGPWRYSRYSLRLFLVTRDGVREVSTECDFSDSTRTNEQRSNYRFDALSSVQVTERDNIGYDLELVLSNGPARKIRVKDADMHQLAPDENAQELSNINLDAAGFAHAFRLLEGIAADGKGWIERNNPSIPTRSIADD
ncbi:hypothetical protein ABZY93_21755 [Streptomyces smyrnaeus]|uniref:hypothetical protein n=1 Tax=Streptomyces smyrnaeus TaxID=1387713 RepID=UPI0033A5F51A